MYNMSEAEEPGGGDGNSDGAGYVKFEESLSDGESLETMVNARSAAALGMMMCPVSNVPC